VEQFSAFAYYERAYCYVQLLCNSYRHSGNREKHIEYKQLAIDDLLKAKERLVAYKEELWVTQMFVFISRSTNNFYSRFANSMRKRNYVITYIEQTIDKELQLLRALDNNMDISDIAYSVTWCDMTSGLEMLTRVDDDTRQAVSEVRQLGLVNVFNVTIQPATLDSDSFTYCANLAAIGIQQVMVEHRLGKLTKL
jgi:hypothetical protein